MHKYFQLSTRIEFMGRLKGTLQTVRRQHILLTTGCLNSFVCYSVLKCVCNLLACHRHYIVLIQLTVCSCLLWPYSHLFSNAIRTRQPYPTCSQSSEGRKRHFRNEKVRMFQNKDRLLLLCYPTRSTWSRQPHNWRYSRLKDTNNTDQIIIIHWFEFFFRWLVRNFARVAS